MAKFTKGPFIELTNDKAWLLGTGRCECGAVNDFKVNKSGWPYHYCVADGGCGAINETRAVGNAKRIVKRIDNFDRNCSRKRAYVLVGLAEMPDSEPEPDEEFQNIDDVIDALAEMSTHPKKKDGIKITFFGKEIFK